MGDAKLARLYGGVLGLPITFLIDRQGRIAARFKGEANLDAMERTFRRLLNSRLPRIVPQSRPAVNPSFHQVCWQIRFRDERGTVMLSSTHASMHTRR